MKRIFVSYILLFLFLGNGWVLADEQDSAQLKACEASLDISALPSYTPLLKENLLNLEDYYTCESAVKEDIQICNIFAAHPTQMANCQDTYSRYYATLGKLFKDGRLSDEGLTKCLKSFNTKVACEQFGEVLLSGNTEDCEKIEGITPKNLDLCKEMASSNPTGSTRALFVSVLRTGDPVSCDQIQNSTVATMCKGLLSKNVDGCQLSAGVDHFKMAYCRHLLTEGSSNGTKKRRIRIFQNFLK